MKTRKSIVIGVVAASALASALLYAAPRGNEAHADQAALAQANISLAQAVTVAEQHAGGRAVRAELEDENGVFVYGVEVLTGTQSTDVKVDIRNGQVLSAQADQDDHEAASGENDNEREGEQGED